LGKAFVTINENGGYQPFEVFVNTSKAGSDTAAVSEAIGRLISYVLRLTSPLEPRERLREVWRQLSGIGGGRSLGFGPNRVRSLPDGVAQTLGEYLSNSLPESSTADEEGHGDEERGNGHHPDEELSASVVLGDQPTASQPAAAQSDTDKPETAQQEVIELHVGSQPEQTFMKIGDLCPECGQAAVINEEGCRKCYACGFSEC
jgi:ribonucleoside-diphosphate reductase alpha chain